MRTYTVEQIQAERKRERRNKFQRFNRRLKKIIDKHDGCLDPAALNKALIEAYNWGVEVGAICGRMYE